MAWDGRGTTARGALSAGVQGSLWRAGVEAGGAFPAAIETLEGGRTESTFEAGGALGTAPVRALPGVRLGVAWERQRFDEAGRLVDSGSLPLALVGASWAWSGAHLGPAVDLRVARALGETRVRLGTRDEGERLSPWRLSIGLGLAWSPDR